MNSQRYYDYLIIGQGLAGSLLAWRLSNAGQRVLVIDNANPAAASRVAAGLVNPVTGRRLVKEAKAEDYLQAAEECYAQLAAQFGQTFFHAKPMLRLFVNEAIKQAWRKRATDRDYTAFIGASLPASESGFPEGGFLQYRTGYLATVLLLDSLRGWLLQRDALCTTQFDYAELQVGESIAWRDCQAGRLIFCEGARVTANPWFKYLPMQPAQGEILTLSTTDKLPDWIINGGKWLLPMTQGRFKLGANYIWPTVDKPLDEQTTTAGRQELLARLNALAPAVTHYEVLAHEAGIRPNSLDKQPLLGFHPQYPALAVFNGFGSRGSLLIPYYSKHFTDVLLNAVTLQAEVDIRRVNSDATIAD